MPAPRSAARHCDLITSIIDYELGDLDDDETVELFQQLADDGTLYGLQGHYQRTAQALADAGLITL